MSFHIFSKFSRTPSSIDFLVVGLGNPGDQYQNTRHNAGFMAMDLLCEKENLAVKKSKFHSLCGEWTVENHRVLLMKPQTFMNNSGQAIREAASFYKIPAENVLVLVDDTALEPGTIRIRKSGSPGGHNGLKSVEACLSSKDYPRIRIGVGAKPPERDMINWVLSVPEPNALKAVKQSLEACCEAIPAIVCGKTDAAMNQHNR